MNSEEITLKVSIENLRAAFASRSAGAYPATQQEIDEAAYVADRRERSLIAPDDYYIGLEYEFTDALWASEDRNYFLQQQECENYIP
jgi:hypothetical protein